MADVKHTPGPWVYDGTRIDAVAFRVPSPHHEIDGKPYMQGLVALPYSCGGPDDPCNHHENAMLIAAAPDLLEALIAAQTVLRYLPDMTTNWGGERETMSTRQAEARVIAAIAKATGAARATEGSV
jgi:hypothetical protein